MTDPIQTLFGIKVSTQLASIIMAVLAVLATDAIVSDLSLPGDWSHAIAGVLGISGRNLVIWVSLVSKDPLALWDRLRGKGANTRS